MEISQATGVIQRYIALDVHKEFVLAGGMSTAQGWLMQPRKIEMGKFHQGSPPRERLGDPRRRRVAQSP